jgi:hypothetical protein
MRRFLNSNYLFNNFKPERSLKDSLFEAFDRNIAYVALQGRSR